MIVNVLDIRGRIVKLSTIWKESQKTRDHEVLRLIQNWSCSCLSVALEETGRWVAGPAWPWCEDSAQSCRSVLWGHLCVFVSFSPERSASRADLVALFTALPQLPKTVPAHSRFSAAVEGETEEMEGSFISDPAAS